MWIKDILSCTFQNVNTLNCLIQRIKDYKFVLSSGQLKTYNMFVVFVRILIIGPQNLVLFWTDMHSAYDLRHIVVQKLPLSALGMSFEFTKCQRKNVQNPIQIKISIYGLHSSLDSKKMYSICNSYQHIGHQFQMSVVIMHSISQ